MVAWLSQLHPVISPVVMLVDCSLMVRPGAGHLAPVACCSASRASELSVVASHKARSFHRGEE